VRRFRRRLGLVAFQRVVVIAVVLAGVVEDPPWAGMAERARLVRPPGVLRLGGGRRLEGAERENRQDPDEFRSESHRPPS